MRPELEQVMNLGDLATVYQWGLEFTKAPNIEGWPSSEQFNLRCVSTDVPKLTNTPIEITIRGHKTKQPGVPSYSGTITLTFIEAVDNVISEAIMNWREAIWATNTGVHGKLEDIHAEILLTRFDRQDNPIWQFELKGCVLDDYDPIGGQLADQGEILRPTMTIGYIYFDDAAIISG